MLRGSVRHPNITTGWKPTGVLRLVAALLAVQSHAFTEGNDWRFWKSADGLQESYVRSVAATADGGILARHGHVVGGGENGGHFGGRKGASGMVTLWPAVGAGMGKLRLLSSLRLARLRFWPEGGR